ncbi:MAG TPA: hypothetical protein VK151_08630 [Fluviicola sp.]|nr:hypothetical protein [Fluviicola sp.]
MSVFGLAAFLPEQTLTVGGILGSILLLFRYVLKSTVIIALIEKRKACHLSDNEVRKAKIKAKSRERIAELNQPDPPTTSNLWIERE